MADSGNTFETAGIRVVGASKLRRSMKQAGIDMDDMKDAHLAIGNIVTARARGTVPKSSGKLANTMRAAGTKTMTVVRAGNNRKTNSGVPYAAPIHWGWPNRNIVAQPWLTEAAQDTEPEWFAAYNSTIDEIIEKIQGAGQV